MTTRIVRRILFFLSRNPVRSTFEPHIDTIEATFSFPRLYLSKNCFFFQTINLIDRSIGISLRGEMSVESSANENQRRGRRRRRSIVRQFCLNTSTHALLGIARSESVHNRVFWSISFVFFHGCDVVFHRPIDSFVLRLSDDDRREHRQRMAAEFSRLQLLQCRRTSLRSVHRSVSEFHSNEKSFRQPRPVDMDNDGEFTHSNPYHRRHQRESLVRSFDVRAARSALPMPFQRGRVFNERFPSFLFFVLRPLFDFQRPIEKFVQRNRSSEPSEQRQRRTSSRTLRSSASIPSLRRRWFDFRVLVCCFSFCFCWLGVGFVGLIHHNTELPSIESAGIYFSPGRKHKIGYQKRRNYFLFSPYTDYTEKIDRPMEIMLQNYKNADYGHSKTVCMKLCEESLMWVFSSRVFLFIEFRSFDLERRKFSSRRFANGRLRVFVRRRIFSSRPKIYSTRVLFRLFAPMFDRRLSAADLLVRVDARLATERNQKFRGEFFRSVANKLVDELVERNPTEFPFDSAGSRDDGRGKEKSNGGARADRSALEHRHQFPFADGASGNDLSTRSAWIPSPLLALTAEENFRHTLFSVLSF